MRKLLCLVLCGSLLAGCTALPAATPETARPGQSTAETPAFSTSEAATVENSAANTLALSVVLNGCIAYEVDSAGGSLKTAIAAADLVVFLAGDSVPEDLPGETAAWQDALGPDDRATLDANWPGVYRCARDICADPAAQQGLLDDAGVTTDFAAMDVTEVPARLDRMNEALTRP